MATDSKDTEKPPTTRQLTEQIANGVGALLDEAERRRQDRAVVSEPKPYTEADALRRCIEALQDLQNAENAGQRNRTYDYPMHLLASENRTWDAGDRILRFLAARFNVSLIQIQRPECNRPHLDQVTPDAFFDALRSSAVSQ